jgi:hypothetical protein
MKYLNKSYLVIILVLQLIVHGLQGQSGVDHAFKLTKGKWCSPLERITTIDTQYTSNCFSGFVSNLTINSDTCTNAYFVQPGKVALVTSIGDLLAIITRKGNYIIAYVGVAETKVKKGDDIYEGETIGPLGEIEDGIYDLEIILCKENKFEKRLHLWFNNDFQKLIK